MLINKGSVMNVLKKIYQNRPLDSDRWVIADIKNAIDTIPPSQEDLMVEPNEEYNELLMDLLEYEEQNDFYVMTTAERKAFQMYVQERLGM